MASVRKRAWTHNGQKKTAWVVDYLDAAGKRRLKTFERKKDADAWAVKAQHEVASGTHTADRASVTVADASKTWITRCKAEKLEASTIRQYESHVAQHIAPALGAIRLSQLTAPRVAEFADNMVKAHSRAMTRKVMVSLRSILSTAQRRGRVAQNVATAVRVDAQQRHRPKVEIPHPDEIRAVLAGAKGWFGAFLHVAIFAGLRASELRGLAWPNVDLKKSQLTITQRADEKGVIGSPKSEAARRMIRLPPIARNLLEAWQKDCPASDVQLVFPNAEGKPRSLANLQNRQWGPLQLACGITVERKKRGTDELVVRPRYGVHVTRHFYASWLISQGLTPKRVQALMGHSTIKLTLDTYGHLWPEDAADAARLDAAESALLSPVVEVDATSTQHDALTD